MSQGLMHPGYTPPPANCIYNKALWEPLLLREGPLVNLDVGTAIEARLRGGVLPGVMEWAVHLTQWLC